MKTTLLKKTTWALLIAVGIWIVPARAGETGKAAVVPTISPPNSVTHGKTLTEWLDIYWHWFLSEEYPKQGKVGSVQLLPFPDEVLVEGSDPPLYRGNLEMTLAPGTAIVIAAFGSLGETYNNGTPDDPPFSDADLLASVSLTVTIDGQSVLSDENKSVFYVPATTFSPAIPYATPTDYGSVGAIFFQGMGFVSAPLTPGVHVIHVYEQDFFFGLINDNTWIITVAPR
jgi:hypothetical protein